MPIFTNQTVLTRTIHFTTGEFQNDYHKTLFFNIPNRCSYAYSYGSVVKLKNDKT